MSPLRPKASLCWESRPEGLANHDRALGIFGDLRGSGTWVAALRGGLATTRSPNTPSSGGARNTCHHGPNGRPKHGFIEGRLRHARIRPSAWPARKDRIPGPGRAHEQRASSVPLGQLWHRRHCPPAELGDVPGCHQAWLRFTESIRIDPKVFSAAHSRRGHRGRGQPNRQLDHARMFLYRRVFGMASAGLQRENLCVLISRGRVRPPRRSPPSSTPAGSWRGSRPASSPRGRRRSPWPGAGSRSRYPWPSARRCAHPAG